MQALTAVAIHPQVALHSLTQESAKADWVDRVRRDPGGYLVGLRGRPSTDAIEHAIGTVASHLLARKTAAARAAEAIAGLSRVTRGTDDAVVTGPGSDA